MLKSRDKNKEYKSSDKTSSVEINAYKMRLLVLVKSFQKDVKEIRKEFFIPEIGFQYPKWDKNNILPFLEFITEHSELFYDQLDEEGALKGLQKRRNNFANKVSELAKKYKLPFNFFHNPNSGVASYVIFNIVQPPSNIIFNVDFEKLHTAKPHRWVNVRFYGIISQKELIQLQKHLEFYRKYFESFNEHGISRVRSKMERDLSIGEQLRDRTNKPKKILSVASEESWYLSAFSKNHTAEEIINMAKQKYPQYLRTGYDQITSSQIAKKHKISKAAVRQANKRLNKLSKELFGYALNE